MIAALKVFFHGHQVGKVKAMRPSREDPTFAAFSSSTIHRSEISQRN